MNLSVSFWRLSSPMCRSFSEMSFSFSKSRMSLCESRRMLRIATRASSSRLCTSFTRSRRRSSVERRQVQVNDLAVRIRGQPQVGGQDGLLDVLERAGVEGLDHQRPRFRDADARQLHQRRRSVVVVDAEPFDQGRIGAARADRRQVISQGLDCPVHAMFGIFEKVFDQCGLQTDEFKSRILENGEICHGLDVRRGRNSAGDQTVRIVHRSARDFVDSPISR